MNKVKTVGLMNALPDLPGPLKRNSKQELDTGP